MSGFLFVDSKLRDCETSLLRLDPGIRLVILSSETLDSGARGFEHRVYKQALA